jgi:hypothetical protein
MRGLTAFRRVDLEPVLVDEISGDERANGVHAPERHQVSTAGRLQVANGETHSSVVSR